MGFHRHGELADCLERSMAISDLASVVDLRSGAILPVLAAAHFAGTAQMDAVRNHCGRVCRRRVSNWLRDLLGGGCLSMLTVAAVLRNGDPTKLKSVLVEPLEAGAFVILVARTATGFDGNIARFLSNAGLVFAGRISYGLYIYHILVAMVVNRWMPSQMRFLIAIPSLRLLVFGIATLFTAALSWRFLEQPINRLRGEKTRKALGPIPHGSWEQEGATRSQRPPHLIFTADSSG